MTGSELAESNEVQLPIVVTQALARYLADSASNQDKKHWEEICCGDSRVTAFVKGEVSAFAARKAISQLCAKVVERSLEMGIPSVVSAAQIQSIHKHSNALLQTLSPIFLLPLQTPKAVLLDDLTMLSTMRLSDCRQVTSRRGNSFRRQLMLDLFREAARAFESPPVGLVAGLISQLEGAHVDDRIVRRVLTADTMREIKQEVRNDRARQYAEDIAGVEAERITRRLATQAPASALRESDELAFQVEMLRNYGRRFSTDAQALQAAMECLKHVVNDQAAPIQDAIKALHAELAD